MDRHSDVVQNENGRAVQGASVLILDENGVVATIYADRVGTPQANPIQTDTLGRWSFCAPDGLYQAQVSLGGAIKATVRDIRLEDPADGLAALSASGGASKIGTSYGVTVQAKLDTISTTLAGLSNYTLPAATAATLGGVKVGSGLTVDSNGLLSLSYSYTLPTASAGTLGGVKVGAGLAIDGAGVLSAPYSYTLPTASASVLGGIKVGSGLSIDGAGVLSATGASAGTVSSVNGVTPVSGNVTLNTDNIAESGTPTNQWFTAARVRSVVLTGLSTATNAVLAATDTVLAALGKLQAQITANTTAIGNKQDTSAKDASGGYVGMTGFAHNLKNAAGTILSSIVSAATATRTWTFPDKDGTVAMTSDIPSPAMVLLSTITISAPTAAANFLQVFTSAYDQYVIEVVGVSPNAADTLCFRFANGLAATSLITTSTYTYVPGDSNNGASTFTVPFFPLGGTNAQANGVRVNLTIQVLNVNSAANDSKTISVAGTHGGVGSVRVGYISTTATSGFGLLWQSGNSFTTGTIRVYGIKNT